MQAEVGDDAFDAAGADGVAALAELLGEDGRGGVGVEEAMTDDLLEDLVGAAVVGLGAALAIEQSGGTEFLQALTKLEVALLAEAELGGGGQGAEPFAFALVEHGELAKEEVVRRHREGAAGALKEKGVGKDLEHGGDRQEGKLEVYSNMAAEAGRKGLPDHLKENCRGPTRHPSAIIK